MALLLRPRLLQACTAERRKALLQGVKREKLPLNLRYDRRT